MSDPGFQVPIPAPAPAPRPYNRNRVLVNIVQTATQQLLEDANGTEQEDLALLSRLMSIKASVQEIVDKDPLLHPAPPALDKGVPK